MAPYIPVPDAVELVLYFTIAGRQVVVTLNFRVVAPTPIDTTTMNTLAANVTSWWQATMRPLTGSDVTLNLVKVTDLRTSSGSVVEYPVSTNNTGTAGFVSLPSNVALVTTWRTPLRGRSYRGRNYWSGIPTNVQANATSVLPAYAAGFVSAYGQIGTYVPNTTYRPVVVSRRANGVPRVTGVTTDVTSFSTNSQIDTQRRRLD